MAFLSLKSNALEPTRAEYRTMSAGAALRRRLTVYGLPLLTVLLIIFFSLLLPSTFPTALNFHSLLDDKSVIALLSLASIIPMMAGRIDLTVGYGIILWHVMAIGLQVWYGIPWPVAVVLVLIAGMLLGFFNAMLVEIAQIDSFIATLGTGTIIYAIALWVTGGQQVIGHLPQAFLDINNLSVLSLPIGTFYVAVVAIVLWIVSERLPIGRHLYTIGANPRAAELNGIPVRRYVMSAFLASGFLTAFAGVVLAARLRIGETSVGLEYLLPALVGAFLGSTTIKPGRVNVWGTIIAVIILAVGIAGIEQLGGSFFVEPMFNGVTLVIAIGLAGITQRKASATRRTAGTAAGASKER